MRDAKRRKGADTEDADRDEMTLSTTDADDVTLPFTDASSSSSSGDSDTTLPLPGIGVVSGPYRRGQVQ